MKNPFRPQYAPYVVMAGSLLGFLLRLWTLGSGPDDLGLYEPRIIPWCLLVIASLAVAAALLLCVEPLKNAGKYANHYPASTLGAAGHLLAALAVLLSCFRAAEGAPTVLWLVTVLLGIFSAITLGLGALARHQGSRPAFWVHALPCLFFGLRLFLYCRTWGNVPQTGIFLFPFLASVAVMFAMYQLTCYDVSLGNRRRSLFWSLYAIFLCTVTLASCDDLLFYLSMIAFLATNLCSLRPIRRPKTVTDTSAEE